MQEKLNLKKNFEDWWEENEFDKTDFPSIKHILFDLYISATEDVLTFMYNTLKRIKDD